MQEQDGVRREEEQRPETAAASPGAGSGGAEEYEVVHNEELQRYEVRLGSEVAFLAYFPQGDILHLFATEVPPAFRGRGIAGRMVKHALEEARAAGKKVVPGCPYVASYIKRNPQYKDLVAGEG